MATNNPLKKISQFLGFSTKDTSSLTNDDLVSVDERRQIFKLNEAYYNNNIYDRLIDGGGLDYINDFLGEAKANDIKGIFNPYKRVVEVYAENVFAGTFGQDITISPTKDDGTAIHPSLAPAMAQIAKWSNFNQELKHYVRIGAMQGTVGIRIVSKVGANFPNDDVSQRRVYLEFEHPSTIEDAIRDKRGNVKSLITEYIINQGELSLSTFGAGSRKVKVRELMTKQFIERKTSSTNGILSILPFKFGAKELPRINNQLGVVPYVIVQHSKKSGIFGAWAVQGTERKIDMVNALSAHLDRQIVRHVKCVWTVATAGSPPTEFKFAGNNVVWFELDENTSAPAIVPMVANLSISETLDKMRLMLTEIADSQPELKATDGEYLSGQSGETIAQLRLPAEVKIKSSRTSYEDGLIRASKIAMSWGILLGVFDFGTGTGTREAADVAYNNGLLDYKFDERDALPTTRQEQIQIATQEVELELLEQEAGILGIDPENTPTDISATSETISDTEDTGAGIATTEIEDDI